MPCDRLIVFDAMSRNLSAHGGDRLTRLGSVDSREGAHTTAALADEHVARRWVRRAVTIPVYLCLGTLAVALLPLSVPLALSLDALRRTGRLATLRCTLAITLYLACEAIGLAVWIVGVYLVLNAVVIGVALFEVATHPQVFPQWKNALYARHGSPIVMLALALWLFPKVALGLSGFETGVAVMPLVKGDPDDDPAHPRGRIFNFPNQSFEPRIASPTVLDRTIRRPRCPL